MKMSEHFTYDELTFTDHREFNNTPNEEEMANLYRLAEFLEKVREVLGGREIYINSAFRSEAVNQAVGSKNSSQHRHGCAADIRVKDMTPHEVVTAIINSDLDYDQCIREFGRWTHVSIPNQDGVEPRKMALIIDAEGTRAFA
jgi:hypothetical protein